MIELLQGRLASYRSVDALAEEQALKEMLQELILYALWRNAFFDRAAFQGGTSLRILHGLPRFSEDMDFILFVPNYEHLGDALEQIGPWAGQQIEPDAQWLEHAMAQKIESIDWGRAASDVEPFVNALDRHGLELWGRELFMDRLAKLVSG